MGIGKKIKSYMEDNGLRGNWLSKKLGLKDTQLCNMVMLDSIPKKMDWVKMTTYSNLTIADLVAAKLKNEQQLEVIDRGGECIVRLKKLNNKDVKKEIAGGKNVEEASN